MVIATPEPEKAIAVAAAHAVDAKAIGTVAKDGGIRIKNLGYQRREDYLRF
jgi:hypothetical protein